VTSVRALATFVIPNLDKTCQYPSHTTRSSSRRWKVLGKVLGIGGAHALEFLDAVIDDICLSASAGIQVTPAGPDFLAYRQGLGR
jgi:hypothetical protein